MKIWFNRVTLCSVILNGVCISGPDVSHLPAEKGSTLYQLLSNPDQVTLEHLTAEVFQVSTRVQDR